MTAKNRKLTTRDAYYQDHLPGYDRSWTACDVRFGSTAEQQGFHFKLMESGIKYASYDGVENKSTIFLLNGTEFEEVNWLAEKCGGIAAIVNLRNILI